MNSHSREQQRGAVSLIGAMFLIVSVAMLLAAVQRMAGSSITDSALHSDGIQALFIAESGLERAAGRIDSGIACAALSGESGNIGPGSFTILSAIVAGAVCQVTVRGRVVITTAANAVNRTVEGELTASSKAGSWAAGKKDGGALLLNHDGTSWSQAGTSGDIPDSDLLGISCITADDCWAVGANKKKAELIIHWDGSNWSRVGPYSDIPNKKLYSVSCVNSNDCWAVGDDDKGELIIHWDGSNWSRVGPYPEIPDEKLFGVHCVDSDDCWAVGADKKGELIIHWNGNNWSRISPYASIPNEVLNSVHCVTSSDCWAVGEDKNGELIIHWDGNDWSRFGPYPGVADKKLNSVHCATSNDCWAVGEKDGYENINHWNGTTWTRLANTPSISSKHLNGVHMISATEGYIVGQDGTMAIWDGNTWTGQPAFTGEDLLAITGYDGTNDVVEVVRWREVIQ